MNRNCPLCGEFYFNPGSKKECSLRCKILNNVKKVNDCWEWQKSIDPTGYGVTNKNRKKIHAHRLSYEIFKREIPKKLIVLHFCDNPKCCNPDHSCLGTHKDNTQDMMRKGRIASFKGTGNSRAILDEKKVLKMRELHRKGKSIKKIAELYNIKYFTCLDVINRRNWNHI